MSKGQWITIGQRHQSLIILVTGSSGFSPEGLVIA